MLRSIERKFLDNSLPQWQVRTICQHQWRGNYRQEWGHKLRIVERGGGRRQLPRRIAFPDRLAGPFLAAILRVSISLILGLGVPIRQEEGRSARASGSHRKAEVVGATMNFDTLERRRDPRTQTFVPITLRRADKDEMMSAHLLDLSYGGAGVLTTAYNAPTVGEYIDLEFETPNTDGGTESTTQRETGIVVNSARHEREIRRLGVRFLQHPDIDCGLFDPKDLLSNHRKMVGPRTTASRWETARNFGKARPAALAGAW